MFAETSLSNEKQFRTFLESLDCMSPQVILDQEGRRRMTVHFSIKEYDPATDRVTFHVKQPVKQRFYYNGYFQAPRISGIVSQGESLISSPKFLSNDQDQAGQAGVWQFFYSVERGDCSDEAWIIPTGFECQLRFLTRFEQESSFELVKWFKKLVTKDTCQREGYHQLVSV